MDWWLHNARHWFRFKHVPAWRQFDNVVLCERCVKFPRSGRWAGGLAPAC